MAWKSVQVSMVMPRPDMTALTGGYRRIPVMQIGGDVFCDTLIIARIIDMLHPSPSVFQSGLMANLAIQQWSDMMFRPGAALSLYENAEYLPDDVVTDRAAYSLFLILKILQKMHHIFAVSLLLLPASLITSLRTDAHFCSAIMQNGGILMPI